jgi:hypothetical protein
MPRGRPKKQTTIDAERQKIITQVEEIAREGAAQAMQTLVLAASGIPVKREAITAAQYLLDQVLGRPTQKVESDVAEDQVLSIVKHIKQIRHNNANLGSELEGTELLVEGTEHGVHPVSGAEGDSA